MFFHKPKDWLRSDVWVFGAKKASMASRMVALGSILFFTGYVELVEHRIRDFNDDSRIGMIV
ncbi:hypothetical protein N8702_02355 [Verrucomicrobia bacterium]|nr:hypothetical protein [Verrucomicrobiota bacterium]